MTLTPVPNRCYASAFALLAASLMPLATGAAQDVVPPTPAPATVAIDSSRLRLAPMSTVEEGMQAAAPGVVVQHDNGGAPGGGFQVQMRGVASILSSAAPLYVIDGIIVNNETVNSGLNSVTVAGPVPYAQDPEDNTPNRMSDINPADIARIEFLKGPAATALYGSKGAAGAVIITTAQGRTGGPNWALTGRLGTYLPANTLPLRTFPTYASANAWWQNTLRQKDALPPDLYAGPQNFQRQLFGGGQASGEGDVRVSGGSRTLTYYASLLDKYDNGVMKYTGFGQQAARLNLHQSLSAGLGVGVNLYREHSRTIRGVSGNDNVGIAPYDVFATTPQFVNLSPRPDGQYPTNVFGFANPVADAALLETPTTVDRFIASGQASWDVMKDAQQSLTVLVSGGADFAQQRDQIYAPAALETQQFNHFPGISATDHARTSYNNVDIMAVYHAARIVGLDATTSVGVSQDERHVANPDLVGVGLAPGTTKPTGAEFPLSFTYGYYTRTQSVFAEEQLLALRDRMTVTIGVAADHNPGAGAASTLTAYPRAAVSYRVPHPVRLFDAVTLRAAYGQAGLAPAYGFNYNNAQNFPGTLNGARRGSVLAATPNSDIYGQVNTSGLRPERSAEFETGIDASIAHARAQLSATIYRKRVSDLVLLSPNTVGLGADAINGGQFTNEGLELSAQLVPIRNLAGVNWLLATSYSRNYSRVDALPLGPVTVVPGFGRGYGTYQARVGRSVSEIVNVDAIKADSTPLQVGDAQPDFVMTFGSTLTWRRFRLVGSVDWSNGGNVINLTKAYYDNGFFLLADSAASVKRAETLAGGGLPYVESASFIKIRVITLSYDLPNTWVRSIGLGRLETARLSLSGRNLFAWFSYSGLDPEVSNFGVTTVTRGQDVTPYPPARSVFMSVDLGF